MFEFMSESCVSVCGQKTRLFTVLPLENRHKMALYHLVSQFISSKSDESSVEWYSMGF